MITVIAISKISSKESDSQVAYNKAESNILGLSEYSKLNWKFKLRWNHVSNGIIIKRLEKRFLLKARGNDEHTMVMRKMVNYELTSTLMIFKYDCSYAYGN